MNMHGNPVGIIKKDIYIIKNDINDKVYIGQSLNAQKRFLEHCKGNYDNSLIDAAIQKYGKEHFYYEILESQIENYNEQEKYWIKQYNSLNPLGYNLLEGGQEPPHYIGEEHPSAKLNDAEILKLKEDLKTTKMSLNEIAKKYNISKKQVLRINQGASRALVGEKYPIRAIPNNNGKLTEEQVDDIIYLLKYSYRFNGDIAREYGVEVHTISRINTGKLHFRGNENYPIRDWKSSGVILFTYEQVTDIINELLTTDHSLNSIAKKYGVDFNAIKKINTGETKKYRRKEYTYPLRKPF